MAIAEIFEQDFQRAQIQRSMDGASSETRDRLLASVSPLTLSPGYHRLAYHLMQLESEHQAGIPLANITRWEGNGLVVLHQARTAFEVKHPACSACGVRKANRYAPECSSCGAKFRRRK